MDLLKKLFIFTLIIAFPLGEISRINFPNSVSITLLDISVFLIVIVWILGFIKKKQKIENKLLIPIGVFCLAAVFSLLANFLSLKISELLVSFLYLLRWIFYATIPFVVINFDEKFKNKILSFLLTTGAIVLVMGLVQYFFYPDLRNLRYAGWDEHLYRLFSWSFFDPNFAGSFLVLYFLFVLNTIFKGEKKDLLKLRILAVLTLLSVLLTFSRASFIALFMGVLMLLILKGKKRYALGFLIIPVISILILFKLPNRSEGTNLLRTASGLARLDSFNRAVMIFKDHPVFGVGFDTYRYAQKKYGFIDKNWESVHSGAGTDNSFLFILATTGIVGFFAYLYMWKNLIEFSRSPLFISYIVAVSINSIFINSLFYTFIMFWMWIFVGLKKNK